MFRFTYRPYPELPRMITLLAIRRLLRDSTSSDSDRRMLSKQAAVFEILDLSVDEERPDCFGFQIRTDEGRAMTLREFAQQLPQDPTLGLSQFVKSVELHRSKAFTCSPEEFHGNVISHYRGSLHAWPDHASLRAEFLSMPPERQLEMMDIVDDYFSTRAGGIFADACEYMAKNRRSLGTIEIVLRATPAKNALGLRTETGEEVRKAMQKVVELLPSSEVPEHSYLGDLREYLSARIKNSGAYAVSKEFPHHLWLFGEPVSNWNLIQEFLDFGSLMNSLRESLDYLSDTAKEAAKSVAGARIGVDVSGLGRGRTGQAVEKFMSKENLVKLHAKIRLLITEIERVQQFGW